MHVLEDSPLEVLALNYMSFGFLTLLNNLWTWLAVSFLKIRAPEPELLPPSSSVKPDPVPEVSEPGAVSVPTVVGNGAADVDGVTKGKFKFTLYYEDDRECGSEETLTGEREWEEREGRWEWWESWERLLRVRTGENENGWYTCQDLTALNGNVVRLWEGDFRCATFAGESRDTTASSCLRVW